MPNGPVQSAGPFSFTTPARKCRPPGGQQSKRNASLPAGWRRDA